MHLPTRRCRRCRSLSLSPCRSLFYLPPPPTPVHTPLPQLRPPSPGEWKAKTIDNPAYKGAWSAPLVPNPDFVDEPNLYTLPPLKYLGFELWQVKAGSIFDNVFVGDSLAEATAFAERTWGANKAGEATMREAAKKVEDEAAVEAAKAAGGAGEGDDMGGMGGGMGGGEGGGMGDMDGEDYGGGGEGGAGHDEL